MSIKTFALPAALAGALLCAPLAQSQAAPPVASAPAQARADAGQRGHGAGLFEQLNLTASQRTSIQQLLRQNFEAARPEMQALRQKRVAFDTALPGSSNYATLARDLGEAEASASRDQVQRQADLRTKIYNLLTAEQRTQLAGIQAKRAAEFQQRQQPRPQPPASR